MTYRGGVYTHRSIEGKFAMYETTAKIDGMMCGHCEARVNEAVRAHFDVKKVTSSHEKNTTTIVSELPITKAQLEGALADTVYKVLAVDSKQYEKKGLFGFGK